MSSLVGSLPESFERWLQNGENARRAALAALAALVLAGLLLPPVELGTRLTSIGYGTLRPGESARIPSDPAGALLQVSRQHVGQPGRVRVEGDVGLPAELPAGHAQIGAAYRLDFKGAAPEEASLLVNLPVPEDERPFVDPYGWNGERWVWLPVSFPGAGVAEIHLELEAFRPEVVAMTRAEEGSTRVSAVLLPPPYTVPAAVAELPHLEMRAYHLAGDDGDIEGGTFPVPADPTSRYVVVDNLERSRVRYDLIANILIRPESRRAHRETLVAMADAEDAAGVILDYRGVPGDLQPIYADWLSRLNRDLDRVGSDLIVTAPMPRQINGGWDPSPYVWDALGAASDGVRILLPNDRPLNITDLDSMVRWALGSVERRKLQLSVPVQGLDINLDTGESRLVGFGEALNLVLDMAAADAPRRLTPGESAEVELPSLRAAELQRDPATGMWRFHHWDRNRRQHTVWLNDVGGTKPAFDVAARYRLGQIALDGVSAGLDPALWRMVRSFQTTGDAEAVPTDYRLDWQLVNEVGQSVRGAMQPLDNPLFTFRAPEAEGQYRLGVSLVDAEGDLVAPGNSVELVVGPPPLPTPTPTELRIVVQPTPEPENTQPPPADENPDREPIKADVTPRSMPTKAFDAVLAYPEGVLRAGPGIRFDPVSDVTLGEGFDVLGQTADGQWLYVRIVATGLEGWILGESVDVSADVSDVEVLTTPTPTE